MSGIDTRTTVADLVVREPRAAALLEQLGIDYCCRGRRTLEEACGQHGLDAHTVATLIAGLPHEPDRPQDGVHDVARSSIAELCDHIVVAHHDRLRRDLPAIGELTATVVRVHGAGHPELGDVQRVFAGLRAELESHMEREEREVFPRCKELERADDRETFDQGLLAVLEDDHESVAGALLALRELCDGYDTRGALCGTHRRLLRELQALERDIHQHVHEENNVLFPKVRVLAGQPVS